MFKECGTRPGSTSQCKDCDELLELMNQWYASAADFSVLEDAVRAKLEFTRRGRAELLPDNILRYQQYWDLAKTLPDSCGFTERICVRMFIRTLSSTDSDLMAEVIRQKGFACQSLKDIFALTMDSAKILRIICQSSRNPQQARPSDNDPYDQNRNSTSDQNRNASC
jgi:hypothetical protein